MSSDQLPTAKQRQMLCNMISSAFVEIRSLGWSGNGQQAADLADTFHNIPNDLCGCGHFSWDGFREMLQSYQRKWRVQHSTGRHDYVEVLDEIRCIA